MTPMHLHFDNKTYRKIFIVIKLFLYFTFFIPVLAENKEEKILFRPTTKVTNTYTLQESIETALKNYPSIIECEFRTKSKQAGISLAKTAYLPHLDLFIQELRGSTNNVLGVLFPPLSIPQVSGRQHNPVTFDSTWASNASIFYSWELADFGLRHSQVMEARSAHNQAQKQTDLTRFQVACKAADAFFASAAADQEVKAQKAALERMKVLALTIHSLVSAELKPGVDASRIDAELALFENKYIESEQIRDIRLASLAESLGLAGEEILTNPGNILSISKIKPFFIQQLQNFEYHPLAIHQNSIIKTINSNYDVLRHQWYPHIYFESALFARNSGIQSSNKYASIGYIPCIPNWAVGLKAQFPVMDIFSIKAKEHMRFSEIQAEKARYSVIMQILKGDDAKAKALITGALKLADNAPKFLKAAQDTELRARTRYNVGLATINDIAESERLLVQAQVTYDLAGLAVWRALLAAVEAHGDLTPFLKALTESEGK